MWPRKGLINIYIYLFKFSFRISIEIQTNIMKWNNRWVFSCHCNSNTRWALCQITVKLWPLEIPCSMQHFMVRAVIIQQRTFCPNQEMVTARLGGLSSVSGCWSWRSISCVPMTSLCSHRDCFAFLSGDSALQGGLLLKKCMDIDKRLKFDQKKGKNNLCQIVY